MTMNQAHLTPIEGAVVILAWHSPDDVQAVRMQDGTDRLYVDGRHVAHEHPSQMVINYCHAGKRDQKKWRQRCAEQAAR